jgi:carboxylesterase type B
MAIEWVAKNIHLFGGDPDKVTILGESAGGGSVLHQITAFGGQQGVHFQRAITQSAGYDPVGTAFAAENITQTFFKTLGVSNLAEARQKPSAEVVLANTVQVGFSFPYGSFVSLPCFIPMRKITKNEAN